jgi:hypothetical protein
MKTSIHTRLICCWLALVVLLGSTGFGMVDHWCQMRGHSKSLLLTQAGCKKPCQADEPPAPVSDNPVVKKMPCCKTVVSYEHLDVSRFVADQHPAPAPQPAEFIPNPQFRRLLAALLATDDAVLPSPLADDPLHRTGRSRLIAHATWLI